MSRPEQIALVAFGIMIVLSTVITLWVRYLRRHVVSSPRLFRSARVGCLHLLGCFALLVVGAQTVLASALASVSCAGFLLVACVGLAQRKSTFDRHIAGISALLSLVWLAYWVLETQLAIWVVAASTVEAQYRVDFVVTAPLLYFTTMIFLSGVRRQSDAGIGTACWS
jgi:hypothetical protein